MMRLALATISKVKNNIHKLIIRAATRAIVYGWCIEFNQDNARPPEVY